MHLLIVITEKILRQFHIKLDILALEVFISWHPKLELLVNVEVDIVICVYWDFLGHERKPGIVWLAGSLLDGLPWLLLLFLLGFLEQVLESAWH